MNRREFLSYCIASGMTIGHGGLFSCFGFKAFLSPEDKAQLSRLRIADAHAHPYQFFGSRKTDRATPTIEMMKQLGMVASSFSAVGDMVKYGANPDRRFTMPYSDTMDQLKEVTYYEEKKMMKLIRNASDVPLTIGTNGSLGGSLDDAPGVIMAIEGGDALEGKIENLDKFYQYGVRMITVMHAHNNRIGFHQRSQSDGPLTPFGTQVIERMNELGMVIDVAHTKTQTLKGIVEVSAKPLVDSHTNPMPYGYVHPKPTRLRYWAEMELVAKTGGVICTWPAGYSNKYRELRTTLRHWAEEIVEFKKRLGIEHVGLGTDGGGNLSRKVKGWQSIMSLSRLIGAMREVGLSQDDIAAYTRGNFLRVLKQSLG